MNEYDRARWEGQIDARVGDAERRLDAVNGSIKAHASSVNDLALKVGSLATRVSLYAAIGSAVSAAAVAVALHFLG